MSRPLPGVVARGAVRRRLAVQRGVTIALVAMIAWIAGTAGLGYWSRSGAVCTACHTMQPWVVQASDTAHRQLSCSACHQTSGALGVLPDGLALQRRAVRSLLGVVPRVTTIDDAPCLKCHKGVGTGIIVARGIRVKHADFLEKPCGECHSGTAHPLEGRRYAVPEMDTCMGCHTASPSEITGCTMCHSAQSQRQRRETDTTWRVTHGPTWETTHGLGDMDSCRSCHAADFCVSCHGTPLPHLADWQRFHGVNLTAESRKTCSTCHQVEWCDSCHGVEMPHAVSFLPNHGPEATRVGEEKCARCHAQAGCVDCHLRSAHPQLPGVGMGHGDGQ